MRTIVIAPDYAAWRAAARPLLAEGVAPDEILWSDDPQESPLFADEETSPQAPGKPGGEPPKVPAAFLELARSVAAHTDARRWGLLYRLLWRLTIGGERHLLSMATDRDVRQIQEWRKMVARDIHKMHAFVRFRLVGVDDAAGREQFVAWFEPDYRIVRLAVPFFEKRFAGMDWSILTPSECAHWDGRRLYFTAGLPRSSAPHADAKDDLWRTYYRNIFNPARVKISAMQSEMPRKYWKNLPEAPEITDLIAGSAGRVQEMMDHAERPAKPSPKNAWLESLLERNKTDSLNSPPDDGRP